MNDTQQKYIGWLLIVLLFVSYAPINDMVFLEIDREEGGNNIKVLTENIDELKMLLEVNQSRMEKRCLS